MKCSLIEALIIVAIIGIGASVYFRVKTCGIAGLFVECRITAEASK